MADRFTRPLRTALFAPGSEERKLRRVGTFGADAVILDLEDAVADSEKIAARKTVRSAIGSLAGNQTVMVRVNPGPTGLEDVAAVSGPGLDAIMLPKVESAEDLRQLDVVLADIERRTGLALGTVAIVPLIETARGIADCDAILRGAPKRVLTVGLGTGDLTTDLRLQVGVQGAELLYARSRVVVACRAAGLPAPIDGPWFALEDLEGLEADCLHSLALGFQGRVAIHPPQVQVIQRAYGQLSPEAAERALRIVVAFERAEAQGSASICVDGMFVDYPIYRLARERLQRQHLTTTPNEVS